MAEFAPAGSNPKMTKSQVKKYIKEMEQKRRQAQLEIEKAKLRWEFDVEEDLQELEEKLDELL